ncbi:MAG: glycosyltransferase family 39 protein [Chloroflexota bacterium]
MTPPFLSGVGNARAGRTLFYMVALLALLAFAFALRLWDIGGRGLWYDEAFSVRMARLPFAAMVQATAQDIHPPLYYALLKGWMWLAGDGEAALRLLSAIFGVMGVLFAYQLGTEMAGRRLGLTTGLLTAISPFLVLYSRETRMYTLLLAAITAGGIYAWRATTLQPWRRWAPGYVVAGLVASYAHNTAPFAIAGFNVAYLLLAGPEIWRGWRRSGREALTPAMQWLSCQVAILVLFAPWLVILWEQSARYIKPGGGMGLVDLVGHMGRAFTVGEVPAPNSAWAGPTGWALVLLGLGLALYGPLRRRPFDSTARTAVFAAVWLAVGVGLLYLSVVGRRDFSPRYSAVVIPAFYVLLGICFGQLGRVRWPVAALAWLIFLLPVGLSLQNYYQDPYADRPDQAGAMRVFNAVFKPGDAAVLDAPYLSDVFEYYHRGSVPAFGLPATYPADRSATETALADAAGKYKRIWLLLWQDYYADPDGIVDTWLRDNTIAFSQNQFYGGVRLRGYETRQPGDTVFGGLVKLEGYELVDFRAGWQAKVRLRWRTLAPLGADYQVFVHVVDDSYKFYGQHDGAPNGGQSPTSTWKAGDLIQDEHLVQLPADAEGRELTVRVGLYRLSDGARLTSTAGDNLILAHANVQPGN